MSITTSGRNLHILRVIFACLTVFSILALAVNASGLNAYVVMSNSMRHREYPSALYEFWGGLDYSREQFDNFPVSGGFQAGDIIVAIRTDDLKVGDVVVDTRRDVPITHRIFFLNDTIVMTAGDSLPPQNVSKIISSEIRQRKDIYGKIVAMIPKGGILKALDNCMRSKGCDLAECFITGDCGRLM